MENLMPNLSIDCVIFGFDTELKVLLTKHAEGINKGKWALPGGWVGTDESIDNAATRILFLLTGLKNIYLEQLKAFGDVDRYPGQRVVTVSYYSLIRSDEIGLVPGFTASEVKWSSLDSVGKLLYDHNQILACGLLKLQNGVKQEPIGFNLLPKQFTLLQLQKIYESILQMQLDKPNFRRKILKTGILKKSSGKQTNVAHRSANLFEFDQREYARFKKQKFILDF
ncbi:8-oxo-dGTP diphosphatase [Flagellimonas maritima]|uniref:8-oxo-dGTP diphosphatase n=1 Tax=Flagellimonas maritima TaxID=1383885 RepID=A0A2Z4LPI2_9FLAO|nr:NUDIX domain-containing protein [Allomuricauda aurantiaca]AWX43659.1 8-oxo-dGTP diphosphatase [Allomuricauda aurantiaca]